MLNKKFIFAGLFSIIVFSSTQSLNAELTTLFTTQQEREIIDSNRYKSEKVVKQSPTTVETPKVQQLVQETVTMSYTVSGITISADGDHVAWVNQQTYENGDKLEDSSRIRILSGDSVQIEITAPDGQKYFATSGQTIEVSYQTTADQ